MKLRFPMPMPIFLAWPLCWLVMGHARDLLGMPYDENRWKAPAVLALVMGGIVTLSWYHGTGGMADHDNWDGSLRVKCRNHSRANLRESLPWHYAPGALGKTSGILLLVAALPAG